MRILHVHSGNLFGGVERILIALARHKKISSEFEHAYALCFPGRLADELSESGAEVFSLPSLRLSRPWEIARTHFALRKLLSKIEVDLAIVHSAWSQIAFTRVIQGAGIPLLFWLHTKATGQALIEKLARLRFPNRVLSVSHAVNESAHLLFPGVPSSVVHSPLALDEAAFASANRTATRCSLGASPEQVVIFQASRLEPWKGHRELLQALYQLREIPNWVCWIAGGAANQSESDYLNSLKEQARPLGERVNFLGVRDDVPHLLSAADIYCQPNLEGEGFSIAFMEAFFAGLPIVTSAIGGAVEIVDASSGFLLPPGDTRSLSKTLELLIRDCELRRELGANGRARVLELCASERQFRELERVFKETACHV
jgi:glycosyltransferase involved in cell wall biosynthesis